MLINHDFIPGFPSLTERQAQVLDCIADHMTTKEIARMLDISPSMVDQHLRAISNKMGGLPRRELARLHAEQTARVRVVPPQGLSAKVNRTVSPARPANVPQSMWKSSFVAGFMTGLICGILVVLATIIGVSMLMVARQGPDSISLLKICAHIDSGSIR